jgi:hypothetical protein
MSRSETGIRDANRIRSVAPHGPQPPYEKYQFVNRCGGNLKVWIFNVRMRLALVGFFNRRALAWYGAASGIACGAPVLLCFSPVHEHHES